jgi:two-component system, chemotaxis family, sensor kinase CheA
MDTLSRLLDQIALELVLASPGSDHGLLPVNSLLSDLEQAQSTEAWPPQVCETIPCARQWIDELLIAGVFQDPPLQQLRNWIQWLQQTVQALQANQAPPSKPTFDVVFTTETAPDCTLTSCPIPEPDAESLVLSLDADSDLLREFVQESFEHLQNIELGVLTLEDNPTDHDTLNSIFRAFHTFKGGSGFLNLHPINRLAHELESLLDLARQQKLIIDADVIDVILEGGDTLKQFILQIQSRLAEDQSQTPIEIPTRALLERIRVLTTQPSDNAMSIVPSGTEPVAHPSTAVPDAGPHPTPSTAAGTIKVDTGKLDNLVDLVGEMVIAQSMVAEDAGLLAHSSQKLNRNLAQFNRITKELQRVAMSLRMVPIRSTLQKMTRVVRDLSIKAGKQVELSLSGQETELDRTIIEEINDPLVHMIRNAVDHGIETPAVRVAQGKSPHGTIWLRAFHRGGNIGIEIRDDGSGLNRQRILDKAIAQGIVHPDHAFTDSEIFSLIFAPGFSTAETVTDISGRGVGMDVVRKNIDKLGGKVEIQSTPGHGSTFTILLPLTLAIIDGLLVSVGSRRFIVPTLTVRESFRPSSDMLATVQERGRMVNVRGRLLPLLALNESFDIESENQDPTQAILLVVESDGQSRCLQVDRLLGKQEVVIKSFPDGLPRPPALSGAAILGDGQVAFILDVAALAARHPSCTPRAA